MERGRSQATMVSPVPAVGPMHRAAAGGLPRVCLCWGVRIAVVSPFSPGALHSEKRVSFRREDEGA